MSIHSISGSLQISDLLKDHVKDHISSFAQFKNTRGSAPFCINSMLIHYHRFIDSFIAMQMSGQDCIFSALKRINSNFISTEENIEREIFT